MCRKNSREILLRMTNLLICLKICYNIVHMNKYYVGVEYLSFWLSLSDSFSSLNRLVLIVYNNFKSVIYIFIIIILFLFLFYNLLKSCWHIIGINTSIFWENMRKIKIFLYCNFNNKNNGKLLNKSMFCLWYLRVFHLFIYQKR